MCVSVCECACPFLPQLGLLPAQVHFPSQLLPHDNPERAAERGGRRHPESSLWLGKWSLPRRKTTASNLAKALLGWAPPKLGAIIWVTRNTKPFEKFNEIQQCAKIRMATKKEVGERKSWEYSSSHYSGKEGPQNEEMTKKTEAPYAYLKLEI